ncbi:MAG: amidohydrolase family protein [Planctomycetes bacterium]|nr:amidohydrolase family protein [Planctomycetota bacterium]
MTGTAAEVESGVLDRAPAATTVPAARPERVVLFRGVRLFDGRSDALAGPRDVLVRDGVIERISDGPIGTGDWAGDGAGVLEIEGGGRVLMPGLIDAHWHSMIAATPMLVLMSADEGYMHLAAAHEAGRTLMRGFTTVRDAGGPSFALKRAIDEGLVAGPRIYPSGAMVSQTGGHGDFRMRHEVPRSGGPTHTERVGMAMIADGADEVRRAVREQLMLGASQIKLMAGGGVSSVYDPLDVTQYTVPELRAAVEAAENWGTYVTVHAYTTRAVRQAIEAGVRCIEHGQLLDEDTVKLMAEKGVWWSLQPFLDDEDANPKTGDQRLKQIEVSKGTEAAYELARKHGVRTAFGTDVMFSNAGAMAQGRKLAKLGRWYSPAEVLRMATGDNAELLALSGERNPYPGVLGVVEEGALADLILVDGDPLSDLSLIADPEKNFVVIMKGGVVYKHALD